MPADNGYLSGSNGAGEPFQDRARPVPENVASFLRLRLISGFEEALRRGVEPMHALAAILNVVSAETARIKLDGNARRSRRGGRQRD